MNNEEAIELLSNVNAQSPLAEALRLAVKSLEKQIQVKPNNNLSLIEQIKNEMLKKGCSKVQTESKLVPIVVGIITEKSELMEIETDICKEKWLLNEYRTKAELEKTKYKELEAKCKGLGEILSAEKYYEKAENAVNETNQYISVFLETLKKGETKEGNDQLRKAQMFVQSVKIDTKYDNTAYIVGLSAILSGRPISAIDEIKKINSKIDTKELRWEKYNGEKPEWMK